MAARKFEGFSYFGLMFIWVSQSQIKHERVPDVDPSSLDGLKAVSQTCRNLNRSMKIITGLTVDLHCLHVIGRFAFIRRHDTPIPVHSIAFGESQMGKLNQSGRDGFNHHSFDERNQFEIDPDRRPKNDTSGRYAYGILQFVSPAVFH